MENNKPERTVVFLDENKQSSEISSERSVQFLDQQQEFSVPEIDVSKVISEKPQTTLSGLAGGVTRAVTPYAAGALAGGVAGGPPGAAAGVASVGLAKFIGDPLVIGVNKVLGTDIATPTEGLNAFFNSIGVENPDTATEKFVSILAEGAASGPVRSGVSGVQQAVAGTAAAGTGELTRSSMESLGFGPAAQLGGSVLAGGITGARLSATTTNRPLLHYKVQGDKELPLGDLALLSRRAAKGDEYARNILAGQAATGIDDATYRAARELGLDQYITPGQITTNKVFRELEESFAAIPDSPIAQQRQQALLQTTAESHNILQKFFRRGDVNDLSSNVSRVRNYMTNLTNRLKKRGDDAYADLAASVPKRFTNEAVTTISSLEQRMLDLVPGGLPRPTKTKKGIVWAKPDGYSQLTPIERQVYDALRPIPRLDQTGNIYLQYPSYTALDTARKAVGNAMDNKIGFPNENQARLNSLYNVLTEDQGIFVRNAGVNPAKWETAKQFVRVRKAVENEMQVLFGEQLDKSFSSVLSSSTKSLASGDAAKFRNLIQSVPKSMRQDVALGGLNSLFSKKAVDGSFDLKSFGQWYNAVKSNRQAYGALFDNLPKEARVGLDNLAKVSNAVAASSSKNPAFVSSVIKNVDSVVNRLMYTAASATGIIALQNAIAGVAKTNAASYSAAYGVTSALQASAKNKSLTLANRLIGSPEFMGLVRNMANGRPVDRYVRELSKTQAMIAYAREVGISTRQEDIQNWIEESFTFNDTISNAGTQD